MIKKRLSLAVALLAVVFSFIPMAGVQAAASAEVSYDGTSPEEQEKAVDAINRIRLQ